MLLQAELHPSGVEWTVMGFSAAPAFSLRWTSILHVWGGVNPQRSDRHCQKAELYSSVTISGDMSKTHQHKGGSYTANRLTSQSDEHTSTEECNQSHAYFECVCLVILRMVAPSLPMMAPTNWVGTSMRSGMSDCSLGRVTREGEAWRGGPRGDPPLLLPTAGGSESAVSSGM